MRRRDVITLITVAAVAWPLGVGAQESELPVVGILGATSEGRGLPAFRRGLSEVGYVEGRNVALEYRSAQGEYDRLPALAADLVARKVTVIYSSSITATLAAKAATSIPTASRGSRTALQSRWSSYTPSRKPSPISAYRDTPTSSWTGL